MSTYKTEGRQRLVSFLMRHPDRQYTVDQLRDTLSSEFPSAGSKSSLYRQLAELCRDGTVRKYRSDTQSSFVYQYVGQTDCGRHFHLKCLLCGCLIHLECAMSDQLLAHIQAEHAFCVDSGRSILYGYCRECAAQGAAQNHMADIKNGVH